MILKDLLSHFNITLELPDYLLNQSFNEVFLDGKLCLKDDTYQIVVTTRQNVTHQMFIKPDNEFPLIVMSVLPNGKLKGIKFGQSEGEEIPVNQL